MIAVVVIPCWVICGGFAAVLAQQKGRSAAGFALLGLLLGFIGLLCAACAKPAEQLRQRNAVIARQCLVTGCIRKATPGSYCCHDHDREGW
jgi:hypothetical protein